MSAKEEVIAMIEELPEEATMDDIEYHLYVRRKIQRGLDDLKAGRTTPHEEVKRQFKKWDAQ